MNLVERISSLAVRNLPFERYNAMRGYYLGLRRRLAPLLRLVYGTFDTADLREHLLQRVGQDFKILMVHSSFNNMLPMYQGRPLDLLGMLMDYCGEQRTLVMPAFYFGDPALGDLHAAFTHNPRFDVRRTASQMGMVTELFRRSNGVISSNHPIFRVSAKGPLAAELTGGHEYAESPAGVGSPFDHMTRHDTMIIGIGKFSDVLTQVHYAEELLGDDFPVPRTRRPGLKMTLVTSAGDVPFELSGNGLKWQRDMSKLPVIVGRQCLQEWRFHHVPLFATRAADVTNRLVEAAGRGITIYVRP